MEKDEFRPDVGKKLFFQHQAELEQGLRQMACALGRIPELPDDADFFRMFLNGLWDPYEEVCVTAHRQQKELSAKICALERKLLAEMTPETQDAFGKYNDLLSSRNSTALDYAFLVGYQCAFRFLIMGLSPAAMDFLQEEET